MPIVLPLQNTGIWVEYKGKKGVPRKYRRNTGEEVGVVHGKYGGVHIEYGGVHYIGFNVFSQPTKFMKQWNKLRWAVAVGVNVVGVIDGGARGVGGAAGVARLGGRFQNILDFHQRQVVRLGNALQIVYLVLFK